MDLSLARFEGVISFTFGLEVAPSDIEMGYSFGVRWYFFKGLAPG